MATILFAAAGAALGAGLGGTVLGLSGAVVGRAVGATVGRAIDQRLLGSGSEPVEVGRLDRLHVMGASEGTAIARCWGRMRLPGQVIWASGFTENSRKVGDGKGAPRPTSISYSYSVSVALALCEGQILGVGRIWADGKELFPESLDLRVYKGSESQMPDPLIAAAQVDGIAPGYRGTAYVVLENLSLEPFGNRVPQFAFEVMRAAQGYPSTEVDGYHDAIRGVAVIPGTGEYSLATEKVFKGHFLGLDEPVNASTGSDSTDFSLSLAQLSRELPLCKAASLVVSWFGDDLRCAQCTIRPKTTIDTFAGETFSLPWRSGGISAESAFQVPRIAGAAIYGGTPADGAILQAIYAMKAAGQDVMFYPFILMEQGEGNGLPDPYSDAQDQPAYPWRGRITLNAAHGRAGSSSGTLAARAEVSAFFGSAQASDFSSQGETIIYSGPEEWGYRRFILHYANLCAIAGGVEAFCIGSEMRGLTTIMAENGTFPVVEELVQLAADVRAILGAGVKISYAADWSEYFGHHPNGDVHFHLDPLWASPEIDFVGIDNYMPVSDWRDGTTHADGAWESIYNLEYLRSNIEGGEGYDWFYDGLEGLNAQLRKPIVDGAFGEDWIFRYKDIRSWWSNFHHGRVGGTRAAQPTAWIPFSKPIRFTEFGCPAVDKGTNQPNLFHDPRSSESGFPRFSDGNRDDFIQLQYFRAVTGYWGNPALNPEATLYPGRMIDLEHCYAWAWDARPYPQFPRDVAQWSDGPNWTRGHWLNGRSTQQPYASVVKEICNLVRVGQVDTSRLHGGLTGYVSQEITTGRSLLQPLTLIGGFDPVETDGVLRFLSRSGALGLDVSPLSTALNDDGESSVSKVRGPEAEVSSRIRLGFVSEADDYCVKIEEAATPVESTARVFQLEYTGSLFDGQANRIARRWLIEQEAARDQISFALPPSRTDVSAGSVIRFDGATYRADRVEVGELRTIDATKIENAAYALGNAGVESPARPVRKPPSRVAAFWMDLPPLREGDTFHSPQISVAARPWPGQVAVWRGTDESGYLPIAVIDRCGTAGVLEYDLAEARIGLFDETSVLRVRLATGQLNSASRQSVLSGANAAAIGSGTSNDWEIIQFREATLVAPDTYELRGLLRGQSGTDCKMPVIWPAGSRFVLLDAAVQQIAVPDALRNVALDYRVGNAAKGPSAADATMQSLAFLGAGLRPYSVCHIRAEDDGVGGNNFTWVRRTRVGGDAWEGLDVPLSEESESYVCRIKTTSGRIVREAKTSTPAFQYTSAMRSSDGATPSFVFEVAQVSALYGIGPERQVVMPA